MRILLINGNTTAAITERCAAAARAVAAPGTEIVPLTATSGPRIIGTRTENAIAARGMLELLGEHMAGADAAINAVSFDTALDAMREAAPFPVVGMTEAALHVAAMLGDRIGFLSPGARSVGIYRETVARAGLADRVVSYIVLDMTPQDYLEPDPLIDRVAALLAAAIERDGLEAVILAGAALAGLVPRIQARLPVPAVDGIASAVVLAEGLVRLGYPKSAAGSYAKVPGRELVGLAPAFSRLFPPLPK